MEKQKKSVGTTLLVILLLIVTIAALVLATYAWAKYTEKVGENTANVVVAKWNVTSTVNGTAQYTKQFTHVVPVKMAPGTSGIIPVDVALNDTDVCVKYEIYAEGLTNKPTNVKFYEATKSGTTYTKGTDITANVATAATSSTPVITGYLELTSDNTNVNATGTKYIMWDWPYDNSGVTIGEGANAKTGDEVDTEEGKAGLTMSLKVRVVATQVNPEDVPTVDDNH